MVVKVRFLVKNANYVLVAADVVLSCAVTVLPGSLEEVLNVAMALSRPLLEHLHCLVVTLGAHGVLVCGEHSAGSVNLQPRKQRRVRTVCIQTDSEDDDDFQERNVNITFALGFSEKTALFCTLPSADCHHRRHNKRIRSRR